MNKFSSFTLVLLFLTVILSAQEPIALFSPKVTNELTLPGRLVGGVSLTIEGNYLIPCEDKSLTMASPEGAILAQWQVPDRFAYSAGISTQGLIILPLLKGGLVVLRYQPQQKSFQVLLNYKKASLWACPPVIGENDQIFLSWADGKSALWSPRTSGPQMVKLPDKVQTALYAPGQGYWLKTPLAFLLLNDQGQVLETVSIKKENLLQDSSIYLAQAPDGLIWCVSNQGILSFSPKTGKQIWSEKNFGSVKGLALVQDGRPIILTINALYLLTPTGEILRSLPLPSPAYQGPVIDTRGGFLITTLRGIEYGKIDGRMMMLWPCRGVDSLPFLTSEGKAVWGTGGWKVQFSKGFYPLAPGWSQPSSDPLHSFNSHRISSLKELQSPWLADNSYQALSILASSPKLEDQQNALNLIQTKLAEGPCPWADLILMQILRQGVTDIQLSSGRVTNDWPEIRLKAYKLLMPLVRWEDQGELRDLVQRELDPQVQNQGIATLTKIGIDSDGTLTEMLLQILNNRRDDPTLAQTLVQACEQLWRVNGWVSPPNLVELISQTYKGNYPPLIRRRAQSLFQEILNSD